MCLHSLCLFLMKTTRCLSRTFSLQICRERWPTSWWLLPCARLAGTFLVTLGPGLPQTGFVEKIPQPER